MLYICKKSEKGWFTYKKGAQSPKDTFWHEENLRRANDAKTFPV